MEFKKLLLLAAIAGSLGVTACSEGDNNSLVIEGDTTTNNNDSGGDDGGGDSGVSQSCPDWAAAKNQDADGNDVCALPASITEDRTLTSDIVWYMEDRVTVGNGNREMSDVQGVLESGTEVLAVTLTIEAGTQIKAKSGTFANLLITRGSQLLAEGTADAPIVFSSDDDNLDGTGEWGGLILQGYGDHNLCTALPCNVDSEGESGFAGGFGTPEDSSGSLRYVVVAEGGYEFAPGNEINGISMVAVGSGTTMEYIQVHSNADDGVEFYGGAVNVKYLVLTNNYDDSVDWDEGYQGNLQYVLVKQGPDNEGNVVEGDTEGSVAFLSKPTVANATFIGDSTDTEMLVLKASSGGFFHNSVITTAEGNATIISCVLVDGSGAQANRNTAIAFNNVIADCDSFGDDVLDQSTVFAVAADLDASYASQATEALLVAPIDWAAINTAYPDSVADVDYLDATDYLGAVEPGASAQWYAGWTVEGSL